MKAKQNHMAGFRGTFTGWVAAALLPLSIFAGYPADRPVVLPLPESVAGVGTARSIDWIPNFR